MFLLAKLSYILGYGRYLARRRRGAQVASWRTLSLSYIGGGRLHIIVSCQPALNRGYQIACRLLPFLRREKNKSKRKKYG